MLRLLAKNRDQRPANAGELADHLAQIARATQPGHGPGVPAGLAAIGASHMESTQPMGTPAIGLEPRTRQAMAEEATVMEPLRRPDLGPDARAVGPDGVSAAAGVVAAPDASDEPDADAATAAHGDAAATDADAEAADGDDAERRDRHPPRRLGGRTRWPIAILVIVLFAAASAATTYLIVMRKDKQAAGGGNAPAPAPTPPTPPSTEPTGAALPPVTPDAAPAPVDAAPAPDAAVAPDAAPAATDPVKPKLKPDADRPGSRSISTPGRRRR